MRIALTHVYAWPEVRRGGERYLHELAAALSDAGHEVRIFSTEPAPRRDRVLGVETRYLRRRHYALERRFGVLSEEVAFGLQTLPRVGLRRFDVWHAFGTADAASATIASQMRGLRSVYTDLGISERHWRDARPDRRLYDIVVRRVDHYLCLSGAAARCVERDYGRRTVVMGGGVDLRTFTPSGPRSPTPVLLFPSDVSEPRKNFPMLLAALALLRRRRPSLELWLCGPGDPTPFLVQAGSDVSEATVSIGVASQSSLVDLYRRAWVTVLPSYGEAFGLVVLESLACGTPVVTMADGGPSELIRAGVGVASGPSPEELAEACDEALELVDRPGIVTACRDAAEPHDWRLGIVPRMEEIYRGREPGRS